MPELSLRSRYAQEQEGWGRAEKMCDQAAQVLNVHIYGGDCIVSEDGTVRLIDFNDWPSFAPCRDEAAPHIAECIYRFMKQ